MPDFKKAESQHATAISELDKNVFKQPATLDIIRSWIENEHTYVLMEQETLIGYTAFCMSPYSNEETRGYIFSIAVCKDHQRRGYGRILLEKATELLRKAGAMTVDLDVRPSNTGAIALYEKADFRYYATRKDVYEDGEDALIYIKRFLEAEKQ